VEKKMSLKKLAILIGCLIGLMGILASAQQQTAAALRAGENAADTNSAAKSKLPDVKPDEYSVGESDVIRVNVWKEPEVSQTVVVRTDGSISMPLINEVKVAGMTPLTIQQVIADKLKAYLTNPQVTVTVMEIHSKHAFITGEVARPGGYPLNTETTVLQLIAQAGGFTPFAKKGDIVVLRSTNGKQQRMKFKYKEVISGKKTDQNISLRPGDTVVVP
jgi:polysaccharide biosynthesis/export protein